MTALLPDLTLAPLTRRATLPTERHCTALDALVVLVAPEERALWRRMPHSALWQDLQRREKPGAGKSRSATLPNARQTLVLIGYVKAGASAFERLSFAGKLMRELAPRAPRSMGLLLAPGLADGAAWSEALLSAAWSASFALPEFRRTPSSSWTLRTLELFAAPTLDIEPIAATARAGNLVRALTALPPNKLDARGYRTVLTQLARDHGLQLRWYSEAELEKLGAGAFLAVSRANPQRDAGIAHLRWRGKTRGRRANDASPDVALVGKGILFDTGGVNLKPHRYMLDMHTDMSGSAVALATLVALAELNSPLAADAWLAISENNIGPDAYRPQEVVRALDGTTIQVIHSDAEGRMALADTLALAARTQPRLTLDFATLTGSCIQALTERYSGVFTNRAALADTLVAAGKTSGERVWNFPLDEDFESDLDSSVADTVQCTLDSKGDHILAARFLKRFIGDSNPWVHVDLSSATRRGGLAHVGTEITGFGARWALELLLRQPWRELLANRAAP